MKKLISLFIAVSLMTVPFAFAEDINYGSGVDLVVFEKPESIVSKTTVEYRHDYKENNDSVFLVGTVTLKNLVSFIKGLGSSE